MAIHYIGSTMWTNVTAWAALTAYNVGDIRRQLAAPTAGNERVWRCTTAGTSLASEPSWTLTAGSTTTEVAGPVWTEITGSSTYNAPNNFAAPHFRLRNAFASGWMAAGDTAYISNHHAGTEAAGVTLTSPGTATARCYLLTIDDTQATATLATGSSESATGNSSIVFNGFAYVYGVTFKSASTGSTAGLTFTSASPWHWIIESGGLQLTANDVDPNLIFGNSGSSSEDDQQIDLINCVFTFANASQTVRAQCRVNMKGCSLAGTIPTTLFKNVANTSSGIVNVICCDFSSLDSGNNLVDVSATFTTFFFLDTKTGSGVATVTGTNPGGGGSIVTVVNSDSADPGTAGGFYHYHCFFGDVTRETTIVRTGGASDGTVPYSRKFVSSANASFVSPLEGPWSVFWNEAVGSVTAAIEIVTDNVTLTDAEAWVEVEYMGTSGVPLGLFANDRAADILATPANQTTSSESWPAAPGTPVTQTLSKAITTAEKGWIRARVCLAKASTTLYADPKFLGTSYKQTMLPDGSILNFMKLPAVGEVQSGVTYGPDGTELTGTLAASGGMLRHPGMAGGLNG